MKVGLLFAATVFLSVPAAAQFENLLQDKSLSGWESIGDGSWTLRSDGVLIGQKKMSQKGENQAWFYTAGRRRIRPGI